MVDGIAVVEEVSINSASEEALKQINSRRRVWDDSMFPLIPLPKKLWNFDDFLNRPEVYLVSINSASEEALKRTLRMVTNSIGLFPLIPLPKKLWNTM